VRVSIYLGESKTESSRNSISICGDIWNLLPALASIHAMVLF